jgi:flavin-dependent dehydrogenase
MIIGGGPAGAATAIALARIGASVVLADRSDNDNDTFGESLPPSVRPLLARLGVWDAFLGTEPRPCYANRSSWGSDGQIIDHDFIRDPHGHGWHIDRTRFETMLRTQAAMAGACVLQGAAIDVEEKRREGPWRLRLAGPHGELVAVAPFVVDAGGRATSFARRQGARKSRIDRLIAATAFLTSQEPSTCEGVTLIEAVEDGWWYSAPLPDGRLAAAFFTDADLPSVRTTQTVDGWMSLLSECRPTRERVAEHGYQLTGPPRIVRAGSGVLDRITGDGWLAVGDAAATFDPLSSHGIGAALDGGLRAASVIQAHLSGDGDASHRYAVQMIESFAHYLWMWRAYYTEERRWPDAPFWRRRRAIEQVD